MSGTTAFVLTADRIRDALAQIRMPFFVARFDGGKVAIGTLDAPAIPAIRSEVEKRLQDGGIDATVKVVHHDPVKLRKVRSLEGLLASTGKGTLVFDRTMALQRSEAIVALAGKLRQRLGSSLIGVFFQGERRTLYVVLSPAAGSLAANADRRSELMADIVAAEDDWRRALGQQAFDVAVRIGFDVPAGIDVVAVDRQTVCGAFVQMLRRPLKTRVVAAVIGTIAGASVTVPSLAADMTVSYDAREPAVDQPNFSITTLGGIARDPVLFDHLWAGLGAKGSIPLGDQFGAQLDLGIATDSYYGAALHLFTRDPAIGLAGVFGSAENQHGVSMNRIGAEFEYYVNENFTVAARAGYQTGSAPNGAFGRLDVKFYPDPNLALTAGGEIQPSFSLGRVGFEWRPAASSLPGMSISADASVASNGDYRTMFGLHFQIGGNGQTLLDRDRRSDPTSAIFNQVDSSADGYGGSGT